MEQYYKIAGLIVKMDAQGRTLSQAEPYRIAPQDHADMTIASNAHIRTDILPHLPEDDRFYLSIGSDFYKHLLQFHGMMLHSSAVVVDGRAYLFSANCGTGKSTHTQLWLKQFGSRAYILNDDKPALRLEDGVWYAYGTPWSGKYDISVNARVPISGIAMVERSDTNSIQPFGGFEAVRAVLAQVNRPMEKQYRTQVLNLLNLLFENVPIWKLRCNMDPDAAVVSYEAMSGEKFEEETTC